MVVLSFSIMLFMSFMIEKHNENLKKVLSTCTEIKQDINQKMNHSNMQPDSEHVQKLDAQIQKLSLMLPI
jgi:SPX domain protein involved in polyphosphate accumulation